VEIYEAVMQSIVLPYKVYQSWVTGSNYYPLNRLDVCFTILVQWLTHKSLQQVFRVRFLEGAAKSFLPFFGVLQTKISIYCKPKHQLDNLDLFRFHT